VKETGLKPYEEIRPKLWWDGLRAFERTEALKAVGANPDEPGILAAWNHHKAVKEAELSRHPSRGMPIPDK